MHLEEGTFFGEQALIKEPFPYAITVVAVEPCEVYKLDKEDFFGALVHFPGLYESSIHPLLLERKDMFDPTTWEMKSVEKLKEAAEAYFHI